MQPPVRALRPRSRPSAFALATLIIVPLGGCGTDDGTSPAITPSTRVTSEAGAPPTETTGGTGGAPVSGDDAAVVIEDAGSPPVDASVGPEIGPTTDAGVGPTMDARVAPVPDASTVPWSMLKNPFYDHADWSVKDVGVFYGPDGTIHVYFSAFFLDDGVERCHVAETSSPDFRTFTPAVVVYDGKSDGWVGMCSPDVQKIGDQYVMTFNSWGDTSVKPHTLFYGTSTDLTTWSVAHPLGAELTMGKAAIDAALAPSEGRLFLFWKDEAPLKTRLGVATTIDGPWRPVGNASPVLGMAGTGKDSGRTHENYEVLQIDGHSRLLTTDYSPGPNSPYLYSMHGEGHDENDWLTWEGGYLVNVKTEAFNSNQTANAAYLADRRAADGFFYLFYGGRTEATSHLGRGNNKLGVSRSTDLITWKPAGQ